MKAIKYILIGLGSLLGVYLVLLLFSFSTPAPQEIIKISGNNWDLNTEFHKIDTQFWKQKDGKLNFNNQSDSKQVVTLFSKQLPSEHKKNGYITTRVSMPGNFDLIGNQSIFGFQIGEKGTPQKDHIILALNGAGETVVLNGDMEALTDEKINTSSHTSGNCGEEIILNFHYYNNPYGWIIYFNWYSISDDDCRGRSMVNYIPFNKLNDADKELSLIVFNPSQNGDIWFKDWRILNDWTPND